MLDLPALIFICFSDDYWLKLCLNRQKSVTCFTVTHNSKFENQIKRDFQHWHFMSSSRRLCRCWDQNKSFEPLNFQPGTIKFSSRLIRKVHLVKECFFMYSFWNFCTLWDGIYWGTEMQFFLPSIQLIGRNIYILLKTVTISFYFRKDRVVSWAVWEQSCETTSQWVLAAKFIWIYQVTILCFVGS